MNKDSKPQLDWEIKYCDNCKKQSSFFRNMCTHCGVKVGFDDVLEFLKHPKKMYNQ